MVLLLHRRDAVVPHKHTYNVLDHGFFLKGLRHGALGRSYMHTYWYVLYLYALVYVCMCVITYMQGFKLQRQRSLGTLFDSAKILFTSVMTWIYVLAVPIFFLSQALFIV